MTEPVERATDPGKPPAASGEARFPPLDGPVPDLLLILSDFHLGPGREGATGRYDRKENFFADIPFNDLVRYYVGNVSTSFETERGGPLLVLNGDTFDFVRIDTSPRKEADFRAWSASLAALGVTRSPEELRASVSRKEVRFGLRTDDYKAVWKVDVMASGHEGMFRALAEWVDSGGRVAIIKGNHDLELYWPLVHAAIRARIADRSSRPEEVARRVGFHQEGLRVANLYVEHGHVFESLTSAEGSPVLEDTPTQLRLPLGSFANRYLVNQIEGLEPFLDNIKPVDEVLWAVVRRHPVQALGILFRAAPFLFRAARVGAMRDKLSFLIYFGTIALSLITVTTLVTALAVPRFAAWLAQVPGRFRVVLSLGGIFAPWVLGVIRDLWPKRRPAVGEDEYAASIHEVLRDEVSGEHSRVYAALGHTHAIDVQALPSIAGSEVTYLNSGTWAPVWRRDRPDLVGQVLYTYLEFRLGPDGEYSHRALEWRPDREEPAQATILGPGGG